MKNVIQGSGSLSTTSQSRVIRAFLQPVLQCFGQSKHTNTEDLEQILVSKEEFLVAQKPSNETFSIHEICYNLQI